VQNARSGIGEDTNRSIGTYKKGEDNTRTWSCLHTIEGPERVSKKKAAIRTQKAGDKIRTETTVDIPKRGGRSS